MLEEGAAALLGGIGLLERAVDYTLGSLHSVTPAALPRPTPCRDWTLRELLAHMNDSLLALREAADLGRVELSAYPADGDPIALLKDRACRLLSAWRVSQREAVSIGDTAMTTSILTSAGALEIAVHGWDVAEACGGGRPVPEPLAEELLELAPFLLHDADRPGRFGARVQVSPLAGASDRLLAFTGRRA